MRKFVLALAAAVALPAAANAVTYDAVADFSTSNPSGQWAYGSGVGGTSFTLFSATSTSCFSENGFVCHSYGDYQGVGHNTNGGNVNPPGLATVSIPNDQLWLHPADGAGATDAIVQFTVPTTTTYTVKALFERLSNAANNGNGNGVLVSIFHNSTQVFTSQTLAVQLIAGNQTNAIFSLAANAGDKFSFVVNNNGAYGWDSTGLAATITSVPEPAQWSLMIGGFGLVGGALRSRRRNAALA